jgi:hypothetical protein
MHRAAATDSAFAESLENKPDTNNAMQQPLE